MKRIYTGPIMNMYVRRLELNVENFRAVTDSLVIEKAAPFYRNRFGKLISFHYDSYLPTVDEAEQFITNCASNLPERLDLATCIYADYSKMESRVITHAEFKQLKKTYKKQRKSS